MSQVDRVNPGTAEVSEMLESELKELRQVGQLFRRILGELDQVNAAFARDLETVHRQLLRLDHRVQALEVVALGEQRSFPDAARPEQARRSAPARGGLSLGAANGAPAGRTLS